MLNHIAEEGRAKLKEGKKKRRRGLGREEEEKKEEMYILKAGYISRARCQQYYNCS